MLEIVRQHPLIDEAAIAKQLSDDLRLPKALNAEYVRLLLEDSAKQGFVESKNGRWQLTKGGEDEARSLSTEAAEQLLAGRGIIRKKLEALIGKRLDDGHFEIIWCTLLDFFSELFYSNGLATICAVNEILGADRSHPAANLIQLLVDGAHKVKATCATPELGEEIEQAVLDMFTERSGPAFEWLARVCERFVALCSLGLEAASAEEIRKVLARYHVVLDSDIILTYLCEGEPDHEAARELLNRWLQVGGKILLSSPVLEEVAHHAWISQHDFAETLYLLGKLEPHELRRYAENAFVRAFHVKAKQASDAKKWPLFIRQFKGLSSTDYSNLLDVLQEELMADLLPATHDEQFRDDVSKFMRERLAARRKVTVHSLNREDIGKSERDGQLLASIAAAREAKRLLRADKTIVLLSSSVRLRHANERFRAKLGPPDTVISLRAFSYLLSMLPDNPLGAGTLRRSLFEFGVSAHLPDVERLALRVIRAAGDYDLAFSRRRTLANQLEKVIRSEAEKRGVPEPAFRRQFETGHKNVNHAELIVKAVKNMAIDSKELEDARKQIRALERKLKEMEQYAKTARNPER